MRIALVVWGLRGSGPGRMTLRLAQTWAERGQRPVVVTVGPSASDFYDVPAGVERRAVRPIVGWQRVLPTRLSATRELAVISRLREELAAAAPDVIVSAWGPTNVRVLLASRRLGVPVVVRDDMAPHEPLGPWWETLRRRLYPRASAAVALNDREAGWLARFGAETEVIGQLVDLPEVLPERDEEPVVLAVGRLAPVKRYDLLVEAFSRSGLGDRGWRLRIMGEGPERERILARAVELGVGVELPGATNDVWSEYARAGIFALTSSYESFPMALVEAMTAGVPVVSFDVETGPRALLTHEEDGLLVGDARELASALDRLAGDGGLRAKLTANARQRVVDFAPDAIFARWDDLLGRVAG